VKHFPPNLTLSSLRFACLIAPLLAAATVAAGQKATLQSVPNYAGSVVCSAGEVAVARSVEDIQKAVRQAADAGTSLKVRSVSRSHSYSPVICPEKGGTVLNLAPLDQILAVDTENRTVTVQPGIVIGDLQAKLADYGFTFPVTPDFNGVTVAGAMGTGAHNSSLQIPSAVGDWAQELKLIDGRGEVQTFSGEALDAARVHLGLLGVIFEVKLKIVPQFKLRYGSQKLSDANLERDAAELVRQHAYAKIHWFPEQKTYILDSLDKVPVSTPGASYNGSWTIPAIASLIGNFPYPVQVVNSNKLIQCTLEATRVKTWSSPYKAVDSDPKAPVGFAHDMIGGRCAEGTCAWDRGIKTRTIEAAFDLKDFPQWAQDVKALLMLRSGCFPALGIYLRFSAPSRAYLGQAHGQETVMFEIHIPQTNEQVLEASSEVYDEILQLTLGKYRGRPHWGKNSQPYFQGLGKEQFAKWEDFEEVRQSLDPKGVFLNPFWKAVTSELDYNSGTEQCGVTRECLCRQDSDCGKNASCESGVLFTEARICVKKWF
jgi:L-gulonolactone oxidase